jgi:NarL family two-component system response regulator LiaR
MELIRIVLVDDHDIVRTGLKTFLDMQSEMQVIAEARSGEEAITIAREKRPDVTSPWRVWMGWRLHKE